MSRRAIPTGAWFVAAVLLGGVLPSAQGAIPTEFAELVPPSASPGWFGEKVVLRGTTALVAAPCELPEGPSGAVYVHELDGDEWILVQRITSFIPVGGRRFGTSIDLRGETLAVGAPLEELEGQETGGVYLYRRGAASEFLLEQRLDGVPGNSLFGWSVALSPDGELLVVGAWLADGGVGAAYVYERVGGAWTLAKKLVPSSAPFLGAFGLDVATDGRQVFVSAPFNDDRFSSGGAVFVFDRSGGAWAESARLEPHDLGHFWEFGARMDLEAGALLIGARGADGVVPDSGKAYVFEGRGGVWQEAFELVPAEGSVGGYTGHDVALSGDARFALLGSLYDSRRGFRAGAVHLFRRGPRGWRELGELVPRDAGPGDELCFVAIDGDVVLVGGAMHAHPLPSGGAAWTFRLREPLGTRPVR